MPAKGQTNPAIRDEHGKVIPWKKRNREANNRWKKSWRAAGKEKRPSLKEQREYNAGYRRRNPRALKNAQLKYAYGITIDQFESMLSAQGNKCAVCTKEFSETLSPYVDHSHENGNVRSLLCLHCNTGLGNFRDDRSLLKAAIDYLENHNVGKERNSSSVKTQGGNAP